MKVSKVSLRKIAMTLGAAIGLAALSTTGLAETSTPTPAPGPGMMTGPGAGMMGAPGAGYGPGAMRRYKAPGPGEEPPTGYGMGPAMMYGYGGGYGMGPAMMGRYGMGPEMMYGYGGARYGMGPGMMGGYGMGPEMMYGYGGGRYGMGPGWMHGYGMGPGMMGGYGGGYGMGPGSMRGYGVLDLSDAQAGKIEAIYAAAQKKGWNLGTKLFDAQRKLIEVLAAENPDRHAAVSAYKAASDLRLQRFELGLDTRAKVEAVLTLKQREQMHTWRWGGSAPAQ